MKAKITIKLIDKLLPKPKPYEVRDTDLSGFLLRVQPTGGKTYYLDIRRPNEKRARVKLGTTKAISPTQARDAAKQHSGVIAAGGDPIAKRKEARAATLGEFVEGSYREWVLAHRKTGDEKIVRLKASFSDFWDKPLTEITPWEISQWRIKRAKGPGGMTRSVGTLNRDLAYLKACLSKAVEWSILPDNPLRNVKQEREDKTPSRRYLTEDEESRLVAAILQREQRIKAKRENLRGAPFIDYFRPFVMTALHTGMRWGELTSILWSDVDLDRGIIRIRGEEAKSSQTRDIPLNNTMLRLLTNWRKFTGGQGFVFESPRGGQIKDTRFLWKVTLMEAGVKNLRFHDLRHTMASRLVSNGVDLYVVKEILGHSTISVTERYSHLKSDIKSDAMRKLDAGSE